MPASIIFSNESRTWTIRSYKTTAEIFHQTLPDKTACKKSTTLFHTLKHQQLIKNINGHEEHKLPKAFWAEINTPKHPTRANLSSSSRFSMSEATLGIMLWSGAQWVTSSESVSTICGLGGSGARIGSHESTNSDCNFKGSISITSLLGASPGFFLRIFGPT